MTMRAIGQILAESVIGAILSVPRANRAGRVAWAASTSAVTNPHPGPSSSAFFAGGNSNEQKDFPEMHVLRRCQLLVSVFKWRIAPETAAAKARENKDKSTSLSNYC